MATVINVDPVSRIEGHLKVEATIDVVGGVQQVVAAKVGGTLFRGFEKILVGRQPLDAPDISMRICGVCPVSQGLAATLALESLNNFVIPNNARVLRNLVLAADHLHSHILSFYTLALLDYVAGPAMPPWQPASQTDIRITGSAATNLVNNYTAALDYRRKAHEMGAIFGGRLPHPPSYVPGGFTATPRSTRISQFKTYLADIASWISNVYMADVDYVASTYSDWYGIGAGPKNLISYGVFDLTADGSVKFLKRGISVNGGAAQSLDLGQIREQVTYSWYDNADDNLAPAAGATDPVYPKTGAYSWLKTPRYNNAAFEAGALARMWVNGDYTRGISVMDRHQARAHEALKIAQAMSSWVNELQSSAPTYSAYTVPASGSGVGLTEAPRGALGHWTQVANGAFTRYQIVSPTCWNASPQGAIEQALLGIKIADANNPVEIQRVIRSFDPCLGCAVHVSRPGEGKGVFALRNMGTVTITPEFDRDRPGVSAAGRSPAHPGRGGR